MAYGHSIGAHSFVFADLKTLLARASPARSGDELAGVAAASQQERVAARRALADVPLARFLAEAVVPYEDDEITRLIIDGHDRAAFAPIAHLTVGELRDWLLGPQADSAALARVARGITPEMAAGVSKIMRNQDLVQVARKCRVVTRFRCTIGLPGRLSVRLQPNHPVDDARGIAASIIDGLLYGAGDAVIGINPARDSVPAIVELLQMIDALRARHEVPTQSCVLTHVTRTIAAIEAGAPVDLVFQSIAGTERANGGFGIDLALLREAQGAAMALRRGTVGDNVMYFETGQGSALSAGAHHGMDQQTCEARAYAVAREFAPLLVNSVVGFIGPEYLYDGRQIIRAGLEDHFCGKLLGLPMGMDICYTNHAQADQDDMDTLLTLLGVAGVNFIMGVPGADDVMLQYQSTSFHDALYLRSALGLRRAPEFDAWLERMRVCDAAGRLLRPGAAQALLTHARALDAEAPDGDSSPPAATAAPGTPALVLTDPWSALRRFTPARIALGRAGDSLPTAQVLEFGQAQAQARDAVDEPSHRTQIVAELQAQGFATLEARGAPADRSQYLRRPDLGRSLDAASRARLQRAGEQAPPGGFDIVFVLADGLSALAAARHGVPLLLELRSALAAWRIGPVVVADMARVALGDEVGALLHAAQVAMLIGERPGLSAPDSLGIYLTYAPRAGRRDSERNCISNVRPEGLDYAGAAARLALLAGGARRLGRTGVDLKEDDGQATFPARAAPPSVALAQDKPS